MSLVRPIAVFDAGIGSYAIVDLIRRRLPKQDILYFADRASFPYGRKSRHELLTVMDRTIRFLSQHEPSAIIVASNVPSITVMDELKSMVEVPLFGVLPPLADALSQSQTGKVGIMGVQSMVESPQLRQFVGKHTSDPDAVALINASPMVDLVENGDFLFDPAGTQRKVDVFLRDVFLDHPDIDVLTLSSTHLPWLRSYFENGRPSCRFLDPADAIVQTIGAGTSGSGMTTALVTESPEYPADAFRAMLAKLQIDIPIRIVPPPFQ
ncbi:aspartate/glutamate racemase family protein [Phyllobacterium sp. OV277]|uniref:glutamate racemase n=1 Tax=Phyllobacterium sp. OV277 TaxID=1882772 RepID=UPI000880494A|nr:aspartate/glutamate racemase family protein [Phyllobacterium sp. OV277]SDO60109.1 glutamate racemase [Phyllobacterium sp. OV277]